MPGRTHSRDFKLSVCRQIASGERRPAQVCREHGLAESLLLRWRRNIASAAKRPSARIRRANGSAGTASRGVGALLRATGTGECGAKKSLGTNHVAERHAVIAEAVAAASRVIGPPALCAPRREPGLVLRASASRAGAPSRHGVPLRDAIERIVLAFPGYGYRRVTQALQRDGWTVNHKRVLRVMREESLLCQLKRRFVLTTDSAPRWRTYPNLAERDDPRRTGSGLGRGHHLHPPADGLRLSRRDPGCLLPPLHRLALRAGSTRT